MNRQFPLGGKELWDLRVAGKRPEDMVVLSLIGPQRVENPMLWVGDVVPDANVSKLEWRMLKGLDVEVWASGLTPLPRLLAVLRAILPHAADVFVFYPEPGFRIAVRWLTPLIPVRLVDLDDAPGTQGAAVPGSKNRKLAQAVARRLDTELASSRG